METTIRLAGGSDSNGGVLSEGFAQYLPFSLILLGFCFLTKNKKNRNSIGSEKVEGIDEYTPQLLLTLQNIYLLLAK